MILHLDCRIEADQKQESTQSQEDEGVELIQKQAVEAMARLNVSEIDCLGKPFDPNLAEAVIHIEDDSVEASTVVEVLQKGYTRGDKVIRHSLVKVAN